jgi:energy-coupling factor transporter ATP-binding protein EcfA2
MKDLKITVENVKNIKYASLEFPLEKSLTLIVGSNGSGKSTILLALSQAIRSSLKSLSDDDFDETSRVELNIDGKADVWTGLNKWRHHSRDAPLNGMYEGSLFYGTRFNDSRTVDEQLRAGRIQLDEIVDADDYVKDKLSFFLGYGGEVRQPQKGEK